MADIGLRLTTWGENSRFANYVFARELVRTRQGVSRRIVEDAARRMVALVVVKPGLVRFNAAQRSRHVMPQPHPEALSDLKITKVETIYLRLSDVKNQCDSGQDALLVKITTNSGIVGYGEVDSNPMAAKGAIDGPFSHTAATGLGRVLIGATGRWAPMANG